MSARKFKKKFRLLFAFFILILLISAGYVTAFLVRYSATSERVCRQCHPEHSELWRKSNGHPWDQTSCFQCHSLEFTFKPEGWNVFQHFRDQLAPPEYLADDKLTTQRCLDCHLDVLELNYIVKKRVIQFNHRYHRDEGLECVDCHRSAGHEYMTEGTNRPSVTECLECHIREFEGPPKNQKCLNCHDVMLAPGKSR